MSSSSSVNSADRHLAKDAGLRLTTTMTPAVDLSPAGNVGSQTQSPLSPRSPGHFFHLPSPIITRRTRTYSASEKASQNPLVIGKVKFFCRNKGHGYVTPDDGGEDLFLHVSDVDGEYVPREGDVVSFRMCPVPPKNERCQAVHARIMNMAPGTHEKWDVIPGSPGSFGHPPFD